MVAKVFTPTWRVTAMSRRAAATQKPVTAVDIPKPFVQDLVWTMAIASECDLEAMEWLFDRHFVRGSTIAAFRPTDLRVGNKLVIVYSPFAHPRSGRSVEVQPKELRILLTEALVNAWK